MSKRSSCNNNVDHFQLVANKRHAAFQCFFFVFGLSLGISGSIYLKITYSSNPQFTFYTSSPPPPPPQQQTVTITTSLLLSSPRVDQQHPHLHNMSDDELFWRASMVPRIQKYPYPRVPKVAFMFLTRGPLPLAPLWDKFFDGHHDRYTIYVHTHPSYIFEMPTTSVFHDTIIPSKAVEWGKVSMIDAERRLLANALLDLSNQRFVLLSESCIPIFNFTTIYTHLVNSNRTFVASYDDLGKGGRGRYNPQMWPTISVTDWRKGSQWFEVNRKFAIEIVSDVKYYRVFEMFCTPPCYVDEHYIPTLVNVVSPEENLNRTTTWVDWSKRGPHPEKFGASDVSVEFLNRIRFENKCTYNGIGTNMCFLFARKFLPGTLQSLLQLSYLLFE